MAQKFDYTLDYAQLDLRARPELHRVGIGEQGVLLVQPYKGELRTGTSPHWSWPSRAAKPFTPCSSPT